MRISSVLFASAIAFTTYSLHASAIDLPPGWALLGEAPQLYTATAASGEAASGQGMVLRRAEQAHPYGNAMLVKEFPAAQYAGKNIRVNYKTRTEGVTGAQSGIVLNSDAGTSMTAVPGLKGEVWNKGGIPFSLPHNVKELKAGVWLKGPGSITLDQIDIEVLGDAPHDQKGLMPRGLPLKPI